MGSRTPARDDLVIQRENGNEEMIGPIQLPLGSHTVSPPGHRRGVSESQGLLPNHPSNVFEYSSARGLQGWKTPEALGGGETQFSERSRESGRASPLWSGVPQNLSRGDKERLGDVVVDGLAISSSLPFFALAGAMLWMDGKSFTAYRHEVLNQCSKLAATMFPLCFSVVVGRAIVKFASWKLEKGTSLGLVERLMGSQTVGRALITNVRLWTVSFVTLGLIFLWFLSPVGSQSILRIISIENTTITTTSKITYINTGGSTSAGTQAMFDLWSGFVGLFGASLLAPETVKNSTTDIWGNVKIPFYSRLNNLQQDNLGWRTVSRTLSNSSTVYSAIFGIPVSRLEDNNTSFSLESTYIELSCLNTSSQDTRDHGLFIDPGLISTNGPFRAAAKITSETPWAIGYFGDDQTSLLVNSSIVSLNSATSTAQNSSISAGLLLYQDFTGARNVTSIYCTPSQVYVESIVDCTSTPNTIRTLPSCSVTKQRLSLRPHAPTALTMLSFTQALLGISGQLPASTSQYNQVDLLQNYLVNPNSNKFISSTKYARDSSDESRFLDLSVADFSTRLSQVINTFFIGSIINSTSYLTRESSPSPSNTSTTQELGAQVGDASPLLTTTGTDTLSRPIFNMSIVFLTLFIFATATMFLSAIVAAILTRKIKSRQYIGFVSSLFRESDKTGFPRGGVNMDGLERTRSISQLRIRLGDTGDVEGGWEIGTGVLMRVGRIGVGREGEVGPLDGKVGGLYI